MKMSLTSVNNGLKLELKPEKELYNRGDIPVLHATVTNISEQDVLFCKYHLKHRMLSSLTANGYYVYSFMPTEELPLTNIDFVILKPGQNVTEKLDVKKEKDYEFLYAGKLPPRFPQSMGLSGFPEGDYEFQVFVGKDMVYNTSPEGFHNYGKKYVNILQHVEKQDVSLDLSKAWQGDLLAKCKVKIQ
jgi:hypothetical protein